MNRRTAASGPSIPLRSSLLPTLALWLLAVVATRALAAADEALLCDQSPFDEIRLTAESGGEALKVAPLTLPQRRIPDAPEPLAEIEVRLIERPAVRYRLAWQHIEGITLFEERLLAEAQRLVDEQRFDEAQRDFRWLIDRNSEWPGLSKALEDCAWRRAEAAFGTAPPEKTLLLLEEVWRINPLRTGLSRAFRQPTGQLVERYLREGKWRAARRLVDQFSQRFSRDESETAGRWMKLLARAGDQRLAAARAALAAEDFVAAIEHSRAADACRADFSEAQALLERLLAEHCVVRVGVAAAPSDRFDDWSRRRVDSLIHRRLAEPRVDESPLRSSYGAWTVSDDGRRFELQIDHSHVSTTGGAALARALAAAADRRSPTFDKYWADSLASLGARAPNRLVIEFHEPRPFPAAWLRLPQLNADDSRNDSIAVGYASSEGATTAASVEQHYRRASRAAAGEQPERIVERTYSTSGAAIQALAANDLDLVDRVAPWELPRVQAADNLSLTAYRLPTLHVLVARSAERSETSRDLGRGLAHVIDRAAILREDLLNGQEIAGCQLIDGPFGADSAASGPGGADSDLAAPIAHDPKLGKALLSAALRRRQSRGEQATGPVRIGALSAASEAAQRAAKAIVRRLVASGVAAALVEDSSNRPNEPVDFVYVELILDEPAVDALRLFAPGGPLPRVSAVSRSRLDELLRCPTKNESRRLLQELARDLHSEWSVIPLWQLIEHTAVSNALQGFGDRPTTLYASIVDWRLKTRAERARP